MKNLLLFSFIIIGFVACTSTPNDSTTQNRNIQLLIDSAAYTNDLLSDTNVTVKAEMIPVKISEKPIAKTNSIAKTASKAVIGKPPVAEQTANVPIVTAPPIVTIAHDSIGSHTDTINSNTNNDSGTATSAPLPEAQKKKGLNKAAQGAVIGGVTGAVGGAIISKKKGIGAVVGGIVGAAGGYIIGNKMDKKDK